MMISMLVIMLVDEAGMALNIGHESHLAGAVMGVVLALVWPQNKR
jgi:membrane associated rhomboid family serine protease